MLWRLLSCRLIIGYAWEPEEVARMVSLLLIRATDEILIFIYVESACRSDMGMILVALVTVFVLTVVHTDLLSRFPIGN